MSSPTNVPTTAAAKRPTVRLARLAASGSSSRPSIVISITTATTAENGGNRSAPMNRATTSHSAAPAASEYAGVKLTAAL
jgi:hypothetical protein